MKLRPVPHRGPEVHPRSYDCRHDFKFARHYSNRRSTGAIFDVQPFGGFNLSGTDSKAGGRDYLLHFLQAKSICEKW